VVFDRESGSPQPLDCRVAQVDGPQGCEVEAEVRRPPVRFAGGPVWAALEAVAAGAPVWKDHFQVEDVFDLISALCEAAIDILDAKVERIDGG